MLTSTTFPSVCRLAAFYFCVNSFAQPDASVFAQTAWLPPEEIFTRACNHDSATATFYAALERLRLGQEPEAEKKLQGLYLDLADLLDADEKARWKKLDTDAAAAEFLRRFWIEQDLTPVSAGNERLIEHYQRVFYARRFYTSVVPAGYDDRGRIYVLYGAPDDAVEDVIRDGGAPVSSWVYFRYGRPVIFDFIDEGAGFYLNSRLTDAAKTSNPGDLIFGLLELLEARRSLHYSYYRAYSEIDNALQTGEIGNLNIEALMNEYEAARFSEQARMPRFASEILSSWSEFPGTLQWAQFENASDKIELLAYWGLEPEQLTIKADSLPVVTRVALRDTTMRVWARADTSYRLEPGAESAVGAKSFSLRPDMYHLLFEMKSEAARRYSGYDEPVLLQNASRNELRLSSVILASVVQTEMSTASARGQWLRRGLALTPYPFTTLRRAQPLFVYFEIYGLQPDARDETHYTVEYEIASAARGGLASFLARVSPFESGPARVSFSEEQRGATTEAQTYLQLDFSRLPRGKHELLVRVIDHVAQLTRTAALDILQLE